MNQTYAKTVCPICDLPGAAQLGPVSGTDSTLYVCPRCGKYGIDALVHLTPAQAPFRHLLTAALRKASDAGNHTVVTSDYIDDLLASAPQPRSLFEACDRLLLLLAERAADYWAPVPFDPLVDYPLIAVRNSSEMVHLRDELSGLGWFASTASTITRDGWRRVEQLRATLPKGRQAFVAMSFALDLKAIYLTGFKAGIENSAYFKAFRVDDAEYNEKIDDRIVAEIRRSALVVADFTYQKAGVYFEAGLALGLGIPVIWTCREDELNKLHFDTRQYNHIEWKDAGDLSARLDQRIRATVLPRHQESVLPPES